MIQKNRRRWDLFCSVVDNYGDVGTCWRLARQLATEYKAIVRLWVDNLESFACLCPSVSVTAAVQQVGSVEVRLWPAAFPVVDVADVVIEAFACQLPESYVLSMARRAESPVWINLEYFSAEIWVEGCHLLMSPHPKLPLTKYFFFPGLTSKTGGLIREHDLLEVREAFDESAVSRFWDTLAIADLDTMYGGSDCSIRDDRDLKSGHNREISVSLFCYDNRVLPELLQSWAEGPESLRVLTAPGPATEQVARWFRRGLSPGESLRRGSLAVHAIPFLPHSAYDQLLWSCDINFVRGEDSFVRAQWAQQPFVWQIYPQSEGAHLVKLAAFLTKYLKEMNDPDVVRRFWLAWNGVGNLGTAWRDFVTNRLAIQEHGKVWAGQLDRAGHLADNLVRFVNGK